MKTLEEILKQEPVYLHNWGSKFDVLASFTGFYMYEGKYKDVNILFASYSESNYSGDAFVLLEKSGKLYEVNGSHCSCYGLEDQWELEETSLSALKFRLEKGTLGVDTYCGNEFAAELKDFIGI